LPRSLNGTAPRYKNKVKKMRFTAGRKKTNRSKGVPRQKTRRLRMKAPNAHRTVTTATGIVTGYDRNGNIKFVETPESMEGPHLIEYYETGQVSRQEWREDNRPYKTVEYYSNGREKSEAWFDIEGSYSRSDGPALTEWWENGQVSVVKWMLGGMMHREEGPAIETWFANGQVRRKAWYQSNVRHRADGPASVEYYENGQMMSQEWYLNNNLDRIDGPAQTFWWENGNNKLEKWMRNGDVNCEIFLNVCSIESFENGRVKAEMKRRGEYMISSEWWENGVSKSEEWFLNGEAHRVGGPAVIMWNRAGGIITERWYLYNEPHRRGGPADTEWYDNGTIRQVMWYENGELHRLDGPAVIIYDMAGNVEERQWWDEGTSVPAPDDHEEEEDIAEDDPEKVAASEKRRKELCDASFVVNNAEPDNVFSAISQTLVEKCNIIESEDCGRLPKLRRELGIRVNYQDVQRLFMEEGENEFQTLMRLPYSIETLRSVSNYAVRYPNSVGVDAGGLSRQFFTNAIALMKELFHPLPLGNPRVINGDSTERYYFSSTAPLPSWVLPGQEELAFLTAGRLFAFAAVNELNTDIPLSRFLLHLIANRILTEEEIVITENAILCYILDSNTMLSTFAGFKGFEDEFIETVQETYSYKASYMLPFLEGVLVLTSERSLSAMEFYKLTYSPEITREQFENFLKNVPVSDTVDQYGLTKDQVRNLLLEVGDYRTTMIYWTGEAGLREPRNYKLTLNPNIDSLFYSHTCGKEIEFHPDALSKDLDIEVIRAIFRDRSFTRS